MRQGQQTCSVVQFWSHLFVSSSETCFVTTSSLGLELLENCDDATAKGQSYRPTNKLQRTRRASFFMKE